MQHSWRIMGTCYINEKQKTKSKSRIRENDEKRLKRSSITKVERKYNNWMVIRRLFIPSRIYSRGVIFLMLCKICKIMEEITGYGFCVFCWGKHWEEIIKESINK